MENSTGKKNIDSQKDGFKLFAAKRIIGGILLMVTVVWVVSVVLELFEKPSGMKVAFKHDAKTMPESSKNKVGEVTQVSSKNMDTKDASHEQPKKEGRETVESSIHPAPKETVKTVMNAPATAHKQAEEKPEHSRPVHDEEPEAGGHAVPTHEKVPIAEMKQKPVGSAFVEAVIKPLEFELNQRFWGWRPNDILNFTDNVNNFQLGVLELTRRTTVILTERISRTGATAAFDRNLERAMNWFMIKSDRFWFPSPESKYNSGLKELKAYEEKLEKGELIFYTRTDNLIPLLMAYEDLLGSCEENLVKAKEAGQTPVSVFTADDYFYYSKGVVSAMGTILEAVLKDFAITVESRRGTEVLHHAIDSCHRAAEIDPWIITNSRLNGILANHRANLAAPMSHARFYIGVLIKTLST